MNMVEKNGNGCVAAPRHLAPFLAGFAAAILIFAVAGTAYQANLKLAGSYRGYRTRGNISALVQRLNRLTRETGDAARGFFLEGRPEAKTKLASLSVELRELAADAGRIPVADANRRAQLEHLGASVRELADCAASLAQLNSTGETLVREAGATYLLIDGYVEQLNRLSAGIAPNIRATAAL